MIECKTDEEIVAFDGRVITRLRARGLSLHFHIDFVEFVEIYSDKKDREHWLRIKLEESPSNDVRAITNQRLPPEAIPQAQAFVDEVMRVIASRQD